jgi:hypothetical protein
MTNQLFKSRAFVVLLLYEFAYVSVASTRFFKYILNFACSIPRSRYSDVSEASNIL